MNEKQKLIAMTKKLLYLKGAQMTGKPYNKLYFGKKIPHVTLEYRIKNKDTKMHRMKYAIVPAFTYCNSSS